MSKTGGKWSQSIADEGLTLTTFHVGSPKSLVVLEDWIEFFHDCVELRIRVVTCSEIAGSFQPQILRGRIPAAEIIDLPKRGLEVTELDPIGIWKGVIGSSTPLVAMVKLDTLPYRTRDRGDWVRDLTSLVDRHEAWGVTGFRSHHCRPVDDTHALTTAFSHNFSIVDKESWAHALEEQITDVLQRVDRFATRPDDRFAFEAAVESHLQASGQWNVRPAMSEDWSYAHVNQWEDKLLSIRERYRRRDGVGAFLQSSAPSDRPVWELPPWRRYYGRSKPPLPRRMRVLAGKWRRRLFGD